jgi:hypothetical protein
MEVGEQLNGASLAWIRVASRPKNTLLHLQQSIRTGSRLEMPAADAARTDYLLQVQQIIRHLSEVKLEVPGDVQ